MTYSEPLINQISCFLTSVGFGFIMCLIYMSVKLIFRLVSRKVWSEMVGDGVFVILACFISFFFMIISNNGQVRFNLVAGQMIGAGVMYFTFGRFILKYLYALADVIHGVAMNLLYPVRVYIRALGNTFRKLSELKFKKGVKRKRTEKRKIKNIAKIHLKSENK